MTREKEIEQAMKDSVAETIYASGWGMTPQATDLLECAFTKGAEWADKNPKDGMVSLEKACKWLSNNKDNYIIEIEGETLVDDQIVTDFCKIIEE